MMGLQDNKILLHYILMLLTFWTLALSTPMPPPVSNFCNVGDNPMDPPQINCGSCKGRCNGLRVIPFKIEFPSKTMQEPAPRLCTCDSKCIAYGDCCPDFETECLKEYTEAAAFREQFIYNNVTCAYISTVTRSASIKVSYSFDVRGGYYTFINTCGQRKQMCNETSLKNLLQPNLAVPVTDMNTGLTYINFQCARCNGAVNISWWQPQLSCIAPNVPVPVDGSPVLKKEEDIERYLSLCSVNHMIPDGVEPRDDCLVIKRKCPKACKNSVLVDKCEKSFVTDFFQGAYSGYDEYYANYYCALCNGEELPQLKCYTKYKNTFLKRGGFAQFSLSLLFDFNPSAGLVVGKHPCPPFYARVGGSQECRQVACPEDQRYIDGTCHPQRQTLTFITASIYFNKTQDADTAMTWFSTKALMRQIEERLNINLKEYLNSSRSNDVELNVIQDIQRTNKYNLNLTLDATFEFSINSTLIMGPDTQTAVVNVTEFTNDEMILGLQQLGIDLTLVKISIDGKPTFIQEAFDDCSWFLYSNDEFYIENFTLVIKSTHVQYKVDRHHLVEDKALVCVENEDTTNLDLDITPALGIVTIVFISLSIICLTVRILLQFKIHYYRSHAAKLQFNLCLSLCLAFTMLLIGGIVHIYQVYRLCIIIGVLMYWFFLAAFFWMAAIALDTWLVFRPSSQFVKIGENQKSLYRYAVPCWLLTFIMAAIVIGLDHAEIDQRFKARFGANLCWFNERFALLVYLGVPVAVTTLVTLILFILIVIHLHKSIKDSVRSKKDKESHQLSIYIRLFSLMGVSWIVGFVAAFIGHVALWFIFIILNASQGVLIFISFVIRRPVLKEICRRRPEDSSGTSKGTASTSLHSTTKTSSEQNSEM